MNKLVERIGSTPTGAKIAVVAVIVVAVTALNYFVYGLPRIGPSISELETRIAKVDAEQRKLDGDLIEKTAIANNLNQFRREKELLEQKLQEALLELPAQKNIDELLQLFQDRASKSGLEIATIEPQAAVPEGFYARIPVPMSVTGSFHDIATFFDALSRLRRIVNVNNISMDQPKNVNGRIVLSAKFLATTFMFVEQKKVPGKPGGSAK